jgi:rfaE bifunctional protein kinase chain/domain
VLSADIINRITALAKSSGVPTVVDPKDRNFWAYTGCNLFKPNLREIRGQVNFAIDPDQESLDRAAAFVFERLRCAAVMITLSEHGIYVNDGTTSAIYPTNARKVRDVSGAGDTVISVAACGLAAGMPLPEIARLANRAGAQVIAQSGVVAVNKDELFKG